MAVGFIKAVTDSFCKDEQILEYIHVIIECPKRCGNNKQVIILYMKSNFFKPQVLFKFLVTGLLFTAAVFPFDVMCCEHTTCLCVLWEVGGGTQ